MPWDERDHIPKSKPTIWVILVDKDKKIIPTSLESKNNPYQIIKLVLPLPPAQDQTSSLENSPTQFIQATEWYKVSPVVWKEWKEKERERGHRFKSLNWHF